MSDVVSQLEAVIAGIFKRVPHSDDCAIWGGVNPEGPCDCDVTQRRRTEIAHTVERMINATVAVYMDSRYDEDAGWAAAFRATQEQETKP